MEELKKRTRRFRSKEEISGLLELFKSSGKSKTAFCKEQKIPHNTFSKWLEKSKSGMEKKTKADFLPISFDANTPLIEIIYPNGCRINFYSKIDAGTIKSLLK